MSPDAFLLRYVFTPVAHWFDRVLHINNYRLGAWACMYSMGSTGTVLALRITLEKSPDGAHLFNRFLEGVILVLLFFTHRAFVKCSKAWEKGNRRTLPHDYLVYSSEAGRMILLGFFIIFHIPDIVRVFLNTEPLWMKLVTIYLMSSLDGYIVALYFGAVLPWGGPRKDWRSVLDFGHGEVAMAGSGA